MPLGRGAVILRTLLINKTEVQGRATINMSDKKACEDDEEDEPPSYVEATRQASGARDAASKSTLPRHNEKQTFHKQPQEIETSEFAAEPSTPANGPLQFRVQMRRPLLDFWTISITPLQAVPDLSGWELTYTSKHTANMRRHAAAPQERLVLREIADITFPKPKDIWPGCGPIIKFFPHEAETERKGHRHATPTDRFMQCTGWLTQKYALDLPALNGARVVWEVSDKNLPMADGATHAGSERSGKGKEVLDVQASRAVDQPSASKEKQSWTPFSRQYLVEEYSEDVHASYLRAAPWSKYSGTLTIAPGSSPELVEGVVITTAAMVAMQYYIGLGIV